MSREWDVQGRSLQRNENELVRNPMEVGDEIKMLKAHKSRLRGGAPGRDHHSAIAAQIDVLQQMMQEDEVLQRWGQADEHSNPQWFVAQEALSACRWLNRPERVLNRKPRSQLWEPYLVERRGAQRESFEKHRPSLGQSWGAGSRNDGGRAA